MNEPLAPWTLFRLLACLAVVVLPHFQRLPVWASVLVTVMIIWRGLVSLRHWPFPSAGLRALLAFSAFVGLFLSYGKINSQEAGAGLLVVMVAFKLTEMDKLRDCTIVLMLSYFILITHFLASQEIGTAVYVFGAAVLVTAILLEVSHPQGPLSPRVTLRSAASLLGQAVPLMLLMFVLFPRIPGPIWGIPGSSNEARMGLSNSMQPGTVSQLTRSDEIAFRVSFQGAPPPAKLRYWRGPVFWHYNGETWNEGDGHQLPPTLEAIGTGIRHEVMLEPHNEHWMLALDMPAMGPSGSIYNSAQQLLNRKKIRERVLYQVTSHTDYRLQALLPEPIRERALQTPRFGNPQLRELAESWRANAQGEQAIINRALQMFRNEPFSYTLNPPTLSQASSMDDFLFNTKSGFCEHYASAFTLLMRAAGIPARVVTGYLGGEFNSAGGHLVVRQSDAHAWSEVWLEGRGWVRVDPTAAVAPERIQSGLAASLPESEANLVRRDSDIYWAYQLEDYWEWTNVIWNRAILAYGPELQRQFLERFGIRDWTQMALALTIFVVAFLGILGAVLLWQTRPHGSDDPAVKEWERFCLTLARLNLPRLPHEGPRDYATRICQVRPDLVTDVTRISGLYIGLRYADRSEADTLSRLRRDVRKFRP